ncbi:MAG: hypothetical protein HKN33_07990 [Pyrinomonadaceae bacterium]|nr:hypothetical protein [Pyrinomonadaceae bacterium]
MPYIRGYCLFKDKSSPITRTETGYGSSLEEKALSKFQNLRKSKIKADARLTNRTELFDEFGVLLSEQGNFDDSDLIFKAFEKWGTDCVEHLEGDFAFAIWDQKNERIFCARDHLGGTDLYYYRDSSKFVFASTPSGILDFPGIETNLNLNKLAVYLLHEPHTLTTGETWFEGIYPLAAAESLTMDLQGIKKLRYWRPELETSLPFNSQDEILEAFRELFFETVAARLSNHAPNAALLSGGLDSSSIVSVAANLLEKQNKQLTAFAGVLDDRNDSEFEDEREFIEEFESVENVKIRYVTARDAGPFTDLDGFFKNYDTPIVNSRFYLFRAFSENAAEIGAESILDGSFGEFGPTSYCEGGFAELLKRLKWVTLYRELKLRSRLYGQSLRYNLRGNTLNPLLPEFLTNLKSGAPAESEMMNLNHPLKGSFAKELLSKIELPEYSRRRTLPDHRLNLLRDIRFLFEKSGEFPSSGFGPVPVELRYPFVDKRLIEFSMAVPLEQKMQNGYTRCLIRNGLDGVLPKKIQWRTSKAPFSPDYLRRYYSQIGDVKIKLEGIKPKDPIRELLDIEKIKAWVKDTIDNPRPGTSNDDAIFRTIPQAIFLIHFLRRFAEFSV